MVVCVHTLVHRTSREGPHRLPRWRILTTKCAPDEAVHSKQLFCPLHQHHPSLALFAFMESLRSSSSPNAPVLAGCSVAPFPHATTVHLGDILLFGRQVHRRQYTPISGAQGSKSNVMARSPSPKTGGVPRSVKEMIRATHDLPRVQIVCAKLLSMSTF